MVQITQKWGIKCIKNGFLMEKSEKWYENHVFCLDFLCMSFYPLLRTHRHAMAFHGIPDYMKRRVST